MKRNSFLVILPALPLFVFLIPVITLLLQKNEIKPLNTGWVLYRDTLLSPDGVPSTTKGESFELPGYIAATKEKTNSHGVYTLQRRIGGLTPGSRYGIHLPEIFSAFRFYVDDSLYAQSGTIGTRSEDEKPQWKTENIFITPSETSITLTYHISNFNYHWTGSMSAPVMGSSSAILRESDNRLAMETILFGVILVISFFHVLLYIHHKNDRSVLAFALLSFAFAFRVIVTGELFLTRLFPDFPWEVMVKINFVGIALILLTLGWYIRTLTVPHVSRKQTIITDLLSLSYALLVLVTPAVIHSQALSFYHIVIVVSCVHYMVILLHSCIRGEKQMLFPLAGMVILGVAATNDVLVAQKVIDGIQLSPVALLVFVATQSWMISQRFGKMFDRSEQLSRDLAQLNASLEQKVVERTEELERTNRELRTALDEVKELSGLLPICGHCKSIKDDDGYWHRLEAYMMKRAPVTFSHGLCPKCAQELYPDIDFSFLTSNPEQ